jgi:hypothetical protein
LELEGKLADARLFSQKVFIESSSPITMEKPKAIPLIFIPDPRLVVRWLIVLSARKRRYGFFIEDRRLPDMTEINQSKKCELFTKPESLSKNTQGTDRARYKD